MTILFLDACAIIYRIEAAAPWAERLRGLLAATRKDEPSARIAVSELSRLECRVRPLRERRRALLAAYDRFFAADGLIVVGLRAPVIDLATVIRARHGLRTPDALQAASCLALGSSARFLTNDEGFRRVPKLDVVLV